MSRTMSSTLGLRTIEGRERWTSDLRNGVLSGEASLLRRRSSECLEQATRLLKRALP
jgi:hypothetical protein